MRNPWFIGSATRKGAMKGLDTVPSYDFSWNRDRHIQQYRRHPSEIALYFPWEPYTPGIGETFGKLEFYNSEELDRAKERASRTDTKRYLTEILDSILDGRRSTEDRVRAILSFVYDALYYNPIRLPIEPDTSQAIMDPVQLLELHDARCGQGVAVTLALMETAGIEARSAPVNHHVVAEVKWDGQWHLADALVFGGNQPHRDGEWLSLKGITLDPYFVDRFPMRCFLYEPEELKREDGYWIQGYVFGPWGSLPYYSYYVWGRKDFPPTQPVSLPVQRLGEDTVRLSWGRSFKHGCSQVRYRVEVGASPDSYDVKVEETDDLHLDLTGLSQRTMYFWRIRAIDVSRTDEVWAPWSCSNFCVFPPETYGWFGVI